MASSIRRSIWLNPYVQDLAPFLTSLSLHIAAVLLLMAGYQGYRTFVMVDREQIIIPDAEIVNGQPGGVPNPGLGDDPNRAAAQDQVADAPTESAGWSSKARQSMTNTLMGGGDSDESAIALGAGRGPGRGDMTGAGAGDGAGQLAIFGNPGGGAGLAPRSRFLGVSGNATRVAFVCDSSGSMIDKLDLLKVELRKTLERLAPVQSFSVIFFGEALEDNTGPSLLIANPDNKEKTFAMIANVTPRSGTNPLPALRLAFGQKVQLIYLLTDGDFEYPHSRISNALVINEIRKLNPDKKVKINTFAFLEHGDEYEKVLQQIARENGGVFKYVSSAELGSP